VFLYLAAELSVMGGTSDEDHKVLAALSHKKVKKDTAAKNLL
jgi:hypothetical protein